MRRLSWDTKIWLWSCVIGIGSGLVVGLPTVCAVEGAIYNTRPARLYSTDLNGDGKADYVVVSNDGAYRTIFLQQENGNYKRLDEITAIRPEKLKDINERAANLETQIKESK